MTPSDELTRRVLGDIDLPVFAMVRLRAGDFTYTRREIADMCAAIERLHVLGVHGVVTGALTRSGQIDVPTTTALLAAAAGMPVTFHRAFDRTLEQSIALEQLAELGVPRVLTSGGAPTALEGVARLRELVEHSAGRVAILAGGGIRESNVNRIVLRTGVSEVHTKLTDADEQLTAARVRAFRASVDLSAR